MRFGQVVLDETPPAYFLTRNVNIVFVVKRTLNIRNTMSDQSKSRLLLISLGLALTNVAITLAVLASPFGEGNGSGAIGYSIIRFLVLAVPQLALAIAGVVSAILARRPGGGWIVVALVNLLVLAGSAIQYG